jgi:hypothetical protein
VAVLNFYRTLSGHESLDVPFIGREKLKVIYHNRMTDATGAIRPEIEQGGCQPAGR